MSKSPLSGAFSGSSEPAKKNKKNGAILLIAGIALTSSIGGVFAANSITLNDSQAVEFGQGSAETNACDADLFAVLSQTYSTNDVFRVATVTVGRIDTSACNGKTLQVVLLDDTGAALDTFDVTPNAVTMDTDRSGSSIDAGSVDRIAVTSRG
jgi:hypothetical protein